ncbi:hypothetical protein Dimus_018331 [Dionaea muscipula]
MQCGLISRVEEPKSRQIILRELILPERSRAENAEKMICCFWSKSSGCVPFVMLEASCHLAASDPQNTTGPDLFGFYTREVTDLLSQDEDILPSSRDTEAANASTRMLNDGKGTASYVNPLFGSSLEAALPDFRRGLLKVLLRQSLSTLVQEVDEMLNPVIRIRQMLSILRYTKQNSRLEAIPGPGGEGSYRRLKISTSSSAASMPVQESLVYYGSGKEESGTEDMHSRSFSTGILDKGTTGMTKCAHCGTSETPQWRWGADRRKICNACGLRLAKGKNPSPVEGRKRKMPLHFSKADVEEAGEVNEDFRFLLETGNSLQLEETMKKHSDELSQKVNKTFPLLGTACFRTVCTGSHIFLTNPAKLNFFTICCDTCSYVTWNSSLKNL